MRIFRHHIIGGPGMDLRDRQHTAVKRCHIAADNRLQLADKGRCNHHRIARLLRHGCMTANTANMRVKEHRPGHGDALAYVKGARLAIRGIMHAVDFIHGKFLEKTVFNHLPCPAKTLFRGLEDQHCRTVKFTRFCQMPGRTEKHCCMGVMATGMHRSRCL